MLNDYCNSPETRELRRSFQPACGGLGVFFCGASPRTPFLSEAKIQIFALPRKKRSSYPSLWSFSFIYSLPKAGLVAPQKLVGNFASFAARFARLRRARRVFIAGASPLHPFLGSHRRRSESSLPHERKDLFSPEAKIRIFASP